MPMPGSRFVLALLASVLVLTGCTSNDQYSNRAPGDKITLAEAQILADVLYLDGQNGGADVTVRAQFAEEALLTMTGTVDFTTGTATFDATTTYTTGQPDETRTIYFTPDRLIVGNLPGLTDAMKADGRPDVQYLRAPLDPAARLADNIFGMITRLTAAKPDDPRNLLLAGYRWEGPGRIDNVLANTYSTKSGTVSVGVEDKLLHQFVAPVPGGDFPVTITLTGHGKRTIDFPPEEQIADTSAYPDIAAEFGY